MDLMEIEDCVDTTVVHELAAALRDCLNKRAELGDELVRLREEFVRSVEDLESELKVAQEATREAKAAEGGLYGLVKEAQLREDAWREEVHALETRLDRVEASRERFRARLEDRDRKLAEMSKVLDGYEVALRLLDVEAAVDAVRAAVVDSEVAEYKGSDPLKFLYRTAARGAHPDCGGDSDTFNRVRSAYEQLGGSK